MNVLLILNKGADSDMKILVKLNTKILKNTVSCLIKEKKERAAFEFIVSNAQVSDFIPPGRKILIKPELTLVEDLLE